MHTDGFVELLFGRTRLQCNTQPLDDLASIRANHMAAKDAVRLGIDYQLHQGAFLALGEGQFHWPETAFKNTHLIALLDRLLFAQANSANRRLAEHRCRYVLVVNLTVLLRLEQAPHHGHTLGQRHRGQLHTPDHITNRQNRWISGLKQFVDADEAARIKFDTGVFQAQVIQHRTTPSGVKHAIGDQFTAIVEGGLEASVRLFLDTANFSIELQVHAALFQFLLQVLTHGTVEAAQEQVPSVEQRSFGTEPLENTGKLYRDVTATHHQHALGQVLQVESFVGTDSQLFTRDVRNLRPATSSDQNVLGAVTLPVDLHFMGPGQPRMPLKQGHAAVQQQVAIDTIEPLDFTVLVGDQLPPIELCIFQ